MGRDVTDDSPPKYATKVGDAMDGSPPCVLEMELLSAQGIVVPVSQHVALLAGEDLGRSLDDLWSTTLCNGTNSARSLEEHP